MELARPQHQPGFPTKYATEAKDRQGSIFSQKPYLACVDCNTGWMEKFEGAMGEFAKPIFTSFSEVTLARQQLEIVAGWTALIVVLAEFLDPDRKVVVPASDREFLMNNLKPPDTWTIVGATVNDAEWAAKYHHRATQIVQFASKDEMRASIRERRNSNTLITTFGMGHLLLQTFVCPCQRFIADFRSIAKGIGLSQLWPIGPVGPWAIPRDVVRFPSKLVLNGTDADYIADAYAARIEGMTVTPDQV